MLQSLLRVFPCYPKEFPAWFMPARVCCLSKVFGAPCRDQATPISILKVLYRLWASMIRTVIWKNWAKWFALEVTGLLPSKGAYGAACNVLTTFGIRQVLDYSYFVLWVSHLFWFINGSNPFVSWIASGKSKAPLDGVLVMVSVAFLWVAALKICHEPHLPCRPTHLTGLGFRRRALTIQKPSRLPIMSLILWAIDTRSRRNISLLTLSRGHPYTVPIVQRISALK